jgi:hypothetical protein
MNRKILSRSGDQKGSALIFVIIGMVVVAVLAAGLFSMTSTSAFNQAEAQKATKAYYISESCIRIAASEYKAAANKNTKLVELHNRTLTMPNNQGSCEMEIYPYWFYAPTDVSYAGENPSITLYFPGRTPRANQDGDTNITLPANIDFKGFLKKKGIGGEVYSFTNTTIDSTYTPNTGTLVSLTLDRSETTLNILANSEFYFGYDFPNAGVVGGNLELSVPESLPELTKVFPPEKGMIFLDESCDGNNPIVYSYKSRNESVAEKVTLTNLEYEGECTPDPAPFSGGVKRVYIGKNIGFQSKSKY